MANALDWLCGLLLSTDTRFCGIASEATLADRKLPAHAPSGLSLCRTKLCEQQCDVCQEVLSKDTLPLVLTCNSFREALMTIAMIHLSDLHLRTDRDNPLMGRASALADAIAADVDLGDHCLVLISGDIAFSGLPEQYAVASKFMDLLEERLVDHHQIDIPITFVSVPGNHDCNFSKDDQLRKRALDSITVEALADKSIVEKAITVQVGYSAFDNSLIDDLVRIHQLHDVFRIVTIDAGSKTLQLNLFNSAWCSELHERQGNLLMPVPDRAVLQLEPPSDIVISVLHHPYNWYEPGNARDLRRCLESTSDLIVTGHEHESDTYVKDHGGGQRSSFLEGGVLQDSNDASTSAFNFVLIDAEREQLLIRHFSWLDNKYATIEGDVVQPFERNRRRSDNTFEPTLVFQAYLNDAGTTFSHPHRDPLHLSDIFFYPDMQVLDSKSSDVSKAIISSRSVVNYVQSHRRIVITSPERAGKTSFAKSLWSDLYARGQLPVLLDWAKHAKEKLTEMRISLDVLINEQYGVDTTVRYWSEPFARRTLIIDNVHACKLSRQTRDQIVSAFEKLFDMIVCFGSQELRYEELAGGDEGASPFWRYTQVALLPFGEVLRHRLVTRWYTIGQADGNDAAEIAQKARNAGRVVTSLLGRDLVPSYPIILLTMLQSIESNLNLDINHGSFGHIYNALITLRIAQTSGDRIPLNAKLSYLSEFAYHLYSQQRVAMPADHFRVWHSKHCEHYAVEISYESMLESLTSKGILEIYGGDVRFRYNYTLLFFVARHLAKNLSTIYARDEVRRLASRLYHEPSANIMLFLSHLSDDPIVVEAALDAARALFPNVPEARLDSEVDVIDRLGLSIPRFELPATRPEVNLLGLLENADKEEHCGAVGSTSAYTPEQLPGTEMSESASEEEVAVSDINAAYKTVQTLGQILRNFAGSLPAATKVEITLSCYKLSLRVLKLCINMFEENREDLLEHFAKILSERESEVPAEVLQRQARARLFSLMEILCFSIIRHTSNSLGMQVLAPVFRQALKESDQSKALQFIDLSIKLDHDPEYPKGEVERLFDSVHRSPFLVTLVRMFVYCNFYLFPADPGMRAAVCSKLGIGVNVPQLSDPRVKRVGATRGARKRFKSRRSDG